MKLSKLEIFNYRSIEHLSIHVPQLFALVGPNNVGKSNVLRAILISLSKNYPYLISDDVCDFYNEKTDIPIKIYLQFSDLSEVESKYFRARTRNYMKIRGAEEMKGNYSNLLTVCLEIKFNEPGSFYYVGEDYKPICYPGSEQNSRKVKKEDRVFFPICIAIPDLRDSGKFFSNSVRYEWGQILDTVRDKINSNQEIKKSIESLQKLIESDEQVIKLNGDLKELILEFLTDNFNDVQTAIAPVDPSDLLRSASLLIDDGLSTTLENHGGGVRSLAIIAIILLLAATKENSIITLEEPELFLHPTALFVLNEAMQRRSLKNQVIYTSHSPFLINVTRPKLLGRVFKTASGTQIKQLSGSTHWLSPLGEDQIERDIDAQRNTLFFARSVILTEGPTENLSLPNFAHKIGIDLNKKGVVLVEVNGKPNLRRYSEYLTAFEIPHLIVYDIDKEDSSLNSSIEELPVDKFPMNLDFEQMLLSIKSEELDRILTKAYGETYTKYKTNPIVLKKSSEILDIQLRFLRRSKPFAAKYIAQRIKPEKVPQHLKDIIQKAVDLATS